MENVKRITSFDVDHDFIKPGIYISRKDGEVTTYDLRTRRPNCGDYMDNRTMHSVEHMFATYIRNSEIAGNVLYFGPMGCQTGFYLLVSDVEKERVLEVVTEVLEKIISHDGEMFGASAKECGNYKNLSLDDAKKECARYLEVLKENKNDFIYPTSNKHWAH